MMWPTPVCPSKKDSEKSAGRPRPHRTRWLQDDVGHALNLWATPTNRDYRFPNAKPLSERGGGNKGEQLPNQILHQALGETPLGSTAPTEKPGALNPEFVSWLMGYPPEWVNCAPLATPSCRRLPPK